MTKPHFFNPFIAIPFLLIVACSDDDLSWKKEIEEIKAELNAQNELINTLQHNLTVSSIQQGDNSYTITFSDGTSVQLNNGITPIVSIGDNYHWFINGEDTGISAKGTDGLDGTNGTDGQTPTIEISDDGFWIINGTNTGVSAKGTDGLDGTDGQTPTIEINADGYWVINGKKTNISAKAQITDLEGRAVEKIIATDTNCIFYLTDGTTVTLLFDKVIVFWGDSLTAGAGGSGTTMPKVVGQLLGSKYIIKNKGVGGERSTAICARQGGMPLTLFKDMTLPADCSPIDVKGLLVNYYGTTVEWRNKNAINNCYINGIECQMNINVSSEIWTIQRVSAGEKDELIKAGIPIITNDMRTLRTPYAMVIWIGQNGGWTNGDDLASQVQRMVDYAGVSRFLVIGMHDAQSKQWTANTILQQTFGAKFIDWRQYAQTYALDDAGIDPTEEDLEMSDGRIPISLRSDKVHLNAAGYTVLGKLVYKRMVELGYVE